MRSDEDLMDDAALAAMRSLLPMFRGISDNKIAKAAYDIAEAMVAERNRRLEKLEGGPITGPKEAQETVAGEVMQMRVKELFGSEAHMKWREDGEYDDTAVIYVLEDNSRTLDNKAMEMKKSLPSGTKIEFRSMRI